MIKIARLVVAGGLGAIVFFAGATPAVSHDALRAAPEAMPAAGAGKTGDDKPIKQGDREDQGRSEVESSGDAPKSGSDGCPYIKRKLELIV